MEGQLSAENLKAHEDHLKKETPTIRAPPIMSSAPKMNLRERLAAAGDDKKSDASSGSKRKNTFSRLKAKLKIHSLFGGVGGMSKTGSEAGTRPVRVLENNYRTEPLEGSEFSTIKAEDIMKKVFEGYLKDRPYDPKKFPLLSKSLADMIKERVKQTGIKRHKIVATVLIAEEAGQTVRVGSRCLWNTSYDSYATYVHEGDGFAAIGSVYALYYE